MCEEGLHSRLQGPPGLVSGWPNLAALRSPERPRAGAGVHNGRPGGRGPGPCGQGEGGIKPVLSIGPGAPRATCAHSSSVSFELWLVQPGPRLRELQV